MKQLLTLLILIVSLSVSAQSVFYTNAADNTRRSRQSVEKTFHIPEGATPDLNGGLARGGALFFNTTDSSFYTWTGADWIKLWNAKDTLLTLATKHDVANATGIAYNLYTDDGIIDSIRTVTLPYGSRISWLANNGTYGLDSQKPPFWYFNACDTIANNTYSSGGGASVWNRSTLFTGNRRQYYKGYEYVTNLWANDSVRLESVGGDFGFNLRSTRVLSRSTGNTNRSVIAGAPNNDWDAAPNFIAWDVHSRPSGHSAPHRSRGWWAGISSYPLMNAFADTLDNWIGYISMNRITSSNKIFKYIDYWAGGSIYADSTWGFYARYNTQRHYLAGPVGFGTNNSGATANVDIVGTMRFQDGNQGAGKVLTSDANGWATWQTPAGGGGSTSPAGSDGQVQFNSSGSFGASSNLTWGNTDARFGIGAPAFTSGENLGVKGITGSLTWVRFYSPDGGDYIRFGTDNSAGHIFDWNGGMSFRINNTQNANWSSSAYQFNTGLANIDFRISGDNETNLFYSDASADAVGIGTNVPTDRLTVAGGQVRVTGINTASTHDSVIVINNGVLEASPSVITASGTYTPTSSAVSGGTVTSVQQFMYTRVGSVVTFSGYVSVTPTSGGSLMSFNLSLPIASNFTGDYDAAGVANATLTDFSNGSVFSDATNDAIVVKFIGGASSSAGCGVRITGQYVIK